MIDSKLSPTVKNGYHSSYNGTRGIFVLPDEVIFLILEALAKDSFRNLQSFFCVSKNGTFCRMAFGLPLALKVFLRTRQTLKPKQLTENELVVNRRFYIKLEKTGRFLQFFYEKPPTSATQIANSEKIFAKRFHFYIEEAVNLVLDYKEGKTLRTCYPRAAQCVWVASQLTQRQKQTMGYIQQFFNQYFESKHTCLVD